MGLLARSVLARDGVAALIIIGILMILVGELSALDGLLRGRTWLLRSARKGILVVFLLLAAGSFGFLFSSWTSRLFASPQPWWQGLIENALFFGLAEACFLALSFLNMLVWRWALPLPVEAVPLPERRSWVKKNLVVGSGIGLLLVFFAGVGLDATGLDEGLYREPTSLVLSLCVIGCMIGLVRPFWVWLRWRIKYLPLPALLRVGVCLLVLGMLLLGLASWLVL